MRLFVAIEPPEEVKHELAQLCSGVPGANWVTPERMHLTLRFIGEVNGTLQRDLVSALGEVRGEPFRLRFKGVGHFGERRRAQLLWAGVEADDGLGLLQRRVESAVVRAGLAPEKRRFHPHLTLARLKGAPIERVTGFLSGHGLFASTPFEADAFVLFSSFLSHNGAIYRPEATYPL